MKSTLPNKDELAIRYLMCELDPSEEQMVEKLMIDDQNFLIEVESLRRTYKRTQSLPKMQAPQKVIDGVMQSLGKRSVPVSRTPRILTLRNTSFAAAAIVLVGFGVNWLGAGNEFQEPALMNTDTIVGHEVAPVNDTQDPWIDRRDILHINTAGIATGQTVDSTLQRLRPVDQQESGPRPTRQVQLTGTNR